MKKTLSTIAVALLALTACSQNPSESADNSPQVEASDIVALTSEEIIEKAEGAVEAELPDIPVWEGTRFQGTKISETEVCVDRTYADGKGIVNVGGTAGYVIVEFPSMTLGEPQDGVCQDVESRNAEPVQIVNIPDRIANEPGLMVKTDLGDDWPLMVDYGVVKCKPIVISGRQLQIASFEDPSGREYAVNGTAMTHAQLADIEQIWMDHPEFEGLKINMQPVVDKALSMCN